jgi:hypothetical protein
MLGGLPRSAAAGHDELVSTREPSPAHDRGLSPAERDHVAALERAGIATRGANFGAPLPPELLEPGPACPGASAALVPERRASR